MQKRICFIIQTLGGGGAEKGLVNLINRLDPEKYELHLAVFVPDLGRLSEIRIPVQLHFLYQKGRLCAGKKARWKQAFSFANLQGSFEGAFLQHLQGLPEMDVLFLFMDSPAMSLLAQPKEKTVCIARIAIDYEKFFEASIGCRLPAQRRRHIRLSSLCNKIVCPSEYAKRTYVQMTGLSEHVVRIYNINDQQELEQAAAKIVVPKERFTLVASGRLDPQKGYPRLLSICAQLGKEGFVFDLWILGTGTEKQAIEQKIETLGLTNIRLLGYQANPYPYVKAADLYVSASYFEGLSNSAKEAMLLGVPSVVTDCAGMGEIFGENSEYGLVTKNTDEALYEGMKRLLSDKALYAHYKAKTLERQSFFSVEQSLAQYEALFTERGNTHENT